MDKIIYLTLEQAKAIHRKTITYSGGGIYEILDIDKLYYAVYQCILSYIKESDILSVIDMDTLDEYEQTLIDGMKSMV